VTATAAPQASKHWSASIYRRPDGSVERGLSPAQLRDIVRAGEGELWVDVDSNDLHQHALLEKVEHDRYVWVAVGSMVAVSLAIVWWLKHRQWL